MMKSVGETMAMGRTWQESVQKALRGMETGLDGWGLPKVSEGPWCRSTSLAINWRDSYPRPTSH